MDPSNPPKQDEPEEPRFLDFPHLPDNASLNGKPLLNKYSSTLTRDHFAPGAKAMLYAAGIPDEESMRSSPHVGIASVWWEGNPCKSYAPIWLTFDQVLDLAKTVKDAVRKQEMLAWQYNTIGVSDAITMGGEGMSRERQVF
ncbi:MAG: hypothetical protein Q9222_001881 [Ikaeria aurantiellina]